jgi:hypothetical protein
MADPTVDLTTADRAALELAIKTVRNESAARRKQIDDKLLNESWFAVAAFAAYGCQSKALNLKPWECWPPCKVSPDDSDAPGLEHRNIGKSAALLRQMLALGISRWHPDPLAAIERAEAEGLP